MKSKMFVLAMVGAQFVIESAFAASGSKGNQQTVNAHYRLRGDTRRFSVDLN